MSNADILKAVRPHEALLIIKAVGLRKIDEEMLTLRYVHDMTCEEIANLKHLEVETVRNKVWKARKQFNKYTKGL